MDALKKPAPTVTDLIDALPLYHVPKQFAQAKSGRLYAFQVAHGYGYVLAVDFAAWNRGVRIVCPLGVHEPAPAPGYTDAAWRRAVNSIRADLAELGGLS